MTIIDRSAERRIITIPSQLNLRATVRGTKDPLMVGPTESWWCTRTPQGPGTLRLDRIAPDQIHAAAWGPGQGWMLDQASRLLGLDDELTGLDPIWARRWRTSGMFLGRTDRPWDAVIAGILGQKVQATKARQSRRAIAQRFGTIAPGPRPGRILPAPDIIAELGYADFHPCGVERKRADIIIAVARAFLRFEEFHDLDARSLSHRLQQIHGIGPWTTALVAASSFGDPDAVPVGDFHLPNTVAWALAGEPRADDRRMLQLLEPFRGNRWRIIRLIKRSGSAPKYGPRLSLIDDGLHRGL